MSSEIRKIESPESEDTKLRLGLPGESSKSAGTKRGFSGTIDLNLGSSIEDHHHHNCDEFHHHDDDDDDDDEPNIQFGTATERPSSAKAQVVGWPPVRVSRRNMRIKSCKYVKVAVDGAPYLRKVDLQMFNNYHHLFTALEHMFSCLTIRNYLNQRKMMDHPVNGIEYVPTYEDKDGDWMLVGDVPWKMFVESCKRLRLMKSSEAMGLAPSTPPKRTSTTSKKHL